MPAAAATHNDPILRPSEVAALFAVDVKTVNRWAASGKLPGFRTIGGHWRFRTSDVQAVAESALARADA